MTIKLDENLPERLVVALERLGHSVDSERGIAGVPRALYAVRFSPVKNRSNVRRTRLTAASAEFMKL